MILLSRIDSRLIHGQVVEAWLPHLKVARVVVADDAIAQDALTRTAMQLALPPNVEMTVQRIVDVNFDSLASDTVRTMVLFRDVPAAIAARDHGLPNGTLNIGNVHSAPGRTAVSRSVFLTDAETDQLRGLEREGMTVVIQSLPTERPQALDGR